MERQGKERKEGNAKLSKVTQCVKKRKAGLERIRKLCKTKETCKGKQRRQQQSSPISDMLAHLAVCLHAVACGLQMSLIPADSSCESLMPGSHTFSSGLSQAASACICDSSSNLPFHPCQIKKPNWTGAYVGAAHHRTFFVITFPPAPHEFHQRFHNKSPHRDNM